MERAPAAVAASAVRNRRVEEDKADMVACWKVGASAGARSAAGKFKCMGGLRRAAVARAAEIAITPAVGPEVVTGSTRLRAGTATKLVLNMLSTGAMIRLGTVYSNLMVNVQPSNEKLADRAERIVVELTGLPRERARALFREAESIKAAVLMHAHGLSREKAEALLRDAHGHLRHAKHIRCQLPGTSGRQSRCCWAAALRSRSTKP